MKTEIRNAHPADAEMLAGLGRRAFYEAFGIYNDPSDMQAYLDLAFDPARIREQLSDPAMTYLVASINGTPVGYAKLKRNTTVPELENEKVIQLERIYALQDFIGKKVGSTLMNSCIIIARSEGYHKMWLSVWQENDRAISFYKKYGFQVIGYKQFVIGKEVNEDYVMALTL